jgi:tight adherence protein B
MNGLVAALIGLAALFGDRAVRGTKHAELTRRISPPPAAPVNSKVAIPPWLPWVAGGVVVGFMLGRVSMLFVGAGVGFGLFTFRRRRSRSALDARREEQLADAVGALASAMRSGMSLPQSLAYAAGETEPPLGEEFSALVRALEVGVPLDEAVGNWADAHGAEDARLLAGAMSLHRRSGGDLPAVLDQVAATLRDRVAMTREVRALTAQARLSGIILGALPIGFFGFLWLTARDDVAGALSTAAGRLAVGLGLVLEACAFYWIRSLLAVRA